MFSNFNKIMLVKQDNPVKFIYLNFKPNGSRSKQPRHKPLTVLNRSSLNYIILHMQICLDWNTLVASLNFFSTYI